MTLSIVKNTEETCLSFCKKNHCMGEVFVFGKKCLKVVFVLLLKTLHVLRRSACVLSKSLLKRSVSVFVKSLPRRTVCVLCQNHKILVRFVFFSKVLLNEVFVLVKIIA